MIFEILVTLGVFVILLVISINLIGMFVRGFVPNNELKKVMKEGAEFTKKLAKDHQKTEHGATIIVLLEILGFLFVLYYFWNVALVIASILMMIARIPDLLWEIKNGKENVKNMPSIYMLTTLADVATLPVIWYALYRL